MAIILVGTVVTSADVAADFTNLNGGANISGDDDFVEGTGAIGDKMSASTEILASDNLSGGNPTGTYDLSRTGSPLGEFGTGDHLIGWINTKTPVNATSGITVYFGDGTNNGVWYVMPASFYKGGFITRVINPEFDFDEATGWTLTGNPAQLTAVTEMGFRFTTITSIMGNFNNCQIDQVTLGKGIRVYAGTTGVPNTFEEVRAADEDTNYWGWWSSANGAFVGKGKLYIGPDPIGSPVNETTVFTDTAFTVTFADERIAVGFYEIVVSGSNTDVTWELGSVSAANPDTGRWSLTIDSTTNSFSDTNSVLKGFDILTLDSTTTFTGTTLIDGNKIYQNNAKFDGVTTLDPQTFEGEALIIADNLTDFSDCEFNANADAVGSPKVGSPPFGGHAIEITTPGSYTFSNNTFIGYGADGTDDAAIYNSSEGLVTIAVTGGSGLTVKNKAGSPASTTVITNAVTVRVQGVSEGAAVKVIANETVGTITTGDIIFEKLADSNGVAERTDFNYEGAFDPSGLDIIVRARSSGLPTAAIQSDGGVFTDETEDANTVTGSPIPLINLLPAVPVINDAYYFGHAEMFNGLKLVINTPGTGTYTINWEYWNGTGWENLLDVVDGTDNYKNSGKNKVTWSIGSPGWAKTTINGQGPYYYVRAVFATGTVTVVPNATKVTLDVTKYLPFVQNNTITSTGVTVTASWVEDTIATF